MRRLRVPAQGCGAERAGLCAQAWLPRPPPQPLRLWQLTLLPPDCYGSVWAAGCMQGVFGSPLRLLLLLSSQPQGHPAWERRSPAAAPVLSRPHLGPALARGARCAAKQSRLATPPPIVSVTRSTPAPASPPPSPARLKERSAMKGAAGSSRAPACCGPIRPRLARGPEGAERDRARRRVRLRRAPRAHHQPDCGRAAL